MQIAVGGCLAQKDRETIVRKAPWVDVVFGTHNVHALPTLLDRARHNARAEVEIAESLEVFPSTLPARRESAYAGWVSISVGCNNTCTFCIVPSLRGAERDRRPGDVLAEASALAADGVLEVTLLGQNVNAYGVDFGDRQALREAAAGLRGHRRAGARPVHLAAPARLHLRRDRRDGRDAERLPAAAHAAAVRLRRRAAPDAPLLPRPRGSWGSSPTSAPRSRTPRSRPTSSSGSPGETDADFEATLDVVREARFAQAFTFQYSPRPGTPAADLDGQLPKHVVQERYERLVALQEEISWAGNRAQEGRELEVLVSTGEGRKDGATRRLSGRARDGRLVHFAPGSSAVRPGDVVTVRIDYGAPHHLLAADGVLSHRRTRAGDAHEAGLRPGGAPTVLGLPSFGSPGAPEPSVSGCSTPAGA